MADLGEVPQQKVLVFSLQLVVTLLALGKRAAFFLERLLEVANSFLKASGHFRYGRPDGIAELNLELVFVGLEGHGFPQVRHFPDLAASTVTAVDHDSFGIDFAESNKFAQGAERSRSIIILAC